MGAKRLILGFAIAFLLTGAGLAALLFLGRGDDGQVAGDASGDYEYVDLPTLTYEGAGSFEWGAKVSSVADGDTVRLADGRRIRLVQIDAPERSSECYGNAARRALLRLVPLGSNVALSWDDPIDDRDAYGRFLRYLSVGKLNVNLALVEQGAAVPYFFRGQRGIYADKLLAAAREARRNRRGLWGACPGAKLDPNRGALTGRA